MIIYTAPTKTMLSQVTTHSLQVKEPSERLFVSQSQQVLTVLQSLSSCQRAALWGASKRVCQAAEADVQAFSFEAASDPAILSFNGLQYKQLNWDQNPTGEGLSGLFIVSALYGLLRYDDAVMPYRLDLKDKLSVGGYQNLEDFWRLSLTEHLQQQIDAGEWILDLCSKEYTHGFDTDLWQHERVHHVRFGKQILSKHGEQSFKAVATFAKMGRGMILNSILHQSITSPSDLKDANIPGLSYWADKSSERETTFVIDSDVSSAIS